HEEHESSVRHSQPPAKKVKLPARELSQLGPARRVAGGGVRAFHLCSSVSRAYQTLSMSEAWTIGVTFVHVKAISTLFCCETRDDCSRRISVRFAVKGERISRAVNERSAGGVRAS